MSNNLNATIVSSNQDQKEQTIADMHGVLDAAITEDYEIDVSAGNVILSAAQYRSAIFFKIVGAAVAGRTITLPAVKRLVSFYSDAANAENVDIVKGSTTEELQPEAATFLFTDGTANGLVKMALGGGGNFNVGTSFRGVPGPSDVMLEFIFTEDVTMLAGLPFSFGKAGVAATAQSDFDIQKNGASIGTMRFAAAGTTATFIAGSDTTFTGGDLLKVLAPNPADATLADITFTLSGRR